MNCNEAGTLVAKYADGEVDSLQGRSIEQHLRGCAACAAKHQDLLALRAQIRAEVPYFTATPALRERVRALLANAQDAAPARPRPQRDRWRWLTGGARCRLHGNRARLGARHCGYRLARERGRRRRGRGDARSGDAEQPSDPGRIVGPAHGQAVAFRAARLFAAGAGSWPAKALR